MPTLIEKDESQLMLSTKDNPYNPKESYDEWRQWDINNGYNTEEFIARLVTMDDEDLDIDDENMVNSLTNKSIHSIIEHDVLNIYILV